MVAERRERDHARLACPDQLARQHPRRIGLRPQASEHEDPAAGKAPADKPDQLK